MTDCRRPLPPASPTHRLPACLPLLPACSLLCLVLPQGSKTMAVIETNSCPSGMKSTPLFEEMEEEGGYRTLLENTFLPMLPQVGGTTYHLPPALS